MRFPASIAVLTSRVIRLVLCRDAHSSARRYCSGCFGAAPVYHVTDRDREGEQLEDRQLLTTFSFDYSFDSSNFFDTQEKRDILQLAADAVGDRLADRLTAIEPGPSGHRFDNTWEAFFHHPATGGSGKVSDMSVPADTLVVFVGGRDLGYSGVARTSIGGLHPSGTKEFTDNVRSRGQKGALQQPATDFAPWGGSISFNTTANWYFGTTADGLENDQIDFLTAAELQFARLVGFGIAGSWDRFVSSSDNTFNGPASVAQYGAPVPIDESSSFWATDTASDGIPAAMTRFVPRGERRLLSPLDYAALDDIGWNIATVPAECDYGDAPDEMAGTGAGDYETRAVDDGVSHRIVSGLCIGATVDGDDGTLQNDRANADDVDSAPPDDEDGVVNPLDLQATEGTSPEITILATNTTSTNATLSGWIDYNGDGVFDNASERAQIGVPDGTHDGRFTLTFPRVPEGASGSTYARFRISTYVEGQDSTGTVGDGEVEDHAFVITRVGSTLVTRTAEINSSTANGPTLEDNSFFADSMASIGDLDGDGIPDLAVGESNSDEGGLRRGAVHILMLNADGTVKRTVEINSSTSNGPVIGDDDRFGWSVASVGDLDGDGISELAVGAPDDDEGGGNRGVVHMLFFNADASLKRTVEINSSSPNAPTINDVDHFGSSLASMGDLDGDGIPDLAVGAPRVNVGGRWRGAVHVLMLNADGTVKRSSEINSGTPNGPMLSNEDFFGNSVTSLGDLDGDGVTDIAVGAALDEAGGSNRGTVHVLLLNSDGTVKQTTEINATTPNAPSYDDDDRFGIAVAGIGDLDGDGFPDIAIGASGNDAGVAREIENRGAVHIVLLNADGSVKRSTEMDSETANGPILNAFDFFGASLASVGDLDGDGVQELAVGAFGDDEGGLRRGAVHILYLTAKEPADVDLPAGGGAYEVYREGNDLVLSIEGGAELFRDTAERLLRLTINGTADADHVSVLDTGIPVDVPLVFFGRNGNDSFDASLSAASVQMTGNGGNDVLLGGAGGDTLNGGSGKDELIGNGGNDLVQGQGGTGDTLDGGEGDDTLNGGSGNDVIRETFAGDVILTNSAMSGRGSDVVISAERAFLSGGVAGQTIDVSAFFMAGLTSVTLNGAGGNDVLLGSDGSDVLVGSGGSDRIEGNAGGDRIIGGSGSDTLIGGAGGDRPAFSR